MRPPTRPPANTTHATPTARLAATALAGALALGLAACSGGSSDSAAGGLADQPSSSRDLAAPAPADGDVKAESGAANGGSVGATPAAPAARDEAASTVRAAVTDRKLARRADVSLRVADVSAAAARLRTIAASAGGLVVAEEVTSDVDSADDASAAPDGAEPSVAPRGYGTVTISVPATRLDRTLDAVAEVGRVLARNTSTDDVTGQYVDTAARVATMKASVERVRALMGRATKLADVVSLEAELSRRQADLEAMQQQLVALEDQVALSPITVSLSTAGEVPVPEEDPTGFLAGLAAGWDAFTTSIRLLLTLVGALLPFAVALALVVLPLAAWWRRRHHGEPAVTTTPPTAPAA